MTDDLRKRLLGSRLPDSGCEFCFATADVYVEAVVQGADVERLFPEILAHIAGCPACREDVEGLIAAVRQLPTEEPK